MRIRRFALLLSFCVSLMAASAQQTVIDSLIAIVKQNKRDIQENKALNSLATEYTRTDLQKARASLHSSIELAKTLNSPITLGYAFGQMVTVQINTGRADSAEIYLQWLKELATSSNLVIVENNYHQAAGLFYKKQGNFRLALPHMLETLHAAIATEKMAGTSNSRASVAGACLNVGNTYMEMGEYKQALQFHLQALKIFEALQNKRGESFCYQSIGTDFVQLNQFRQALPYTRQATAIKRELGDKRGVATSLGQIGSIYQGLAQYDLALVYADSALRLIQEMNVTPDEAKVRFNMGKIYWLKKDTVRAKASFLESKALARQIGDSSQVAAADAEMIAMQTTIDRQHQAESKLMSSLKTSIEMGDKSSEVRNYQYLSDHYASNKQFDKALEYSNKYHEISDSLQGLNVQLQIKRLEGQYHLEKKEQEIALLKKDQELNRLNLQKQKAFQFGAMLFVCLLLFIGFLIINRYRIVHKARRLIDMERMRNHIARDLHDDIGSTLTSINILSKMALQQAGKNGEPFVVSNLQKIKDRSSDMMESVSDIVWTINPQNDSLDKMITRMKEFAAEILEPLHIEYQFMKEGDLSLVKLDIKRRKDLYLLFKEAVNNAAKYSECRKMEIHLRQDQQFLHLKVVDDGRGFAEHLVRRGNGLGNMRARASSMQADFRIDTEIGRGTRISVDVPVLTS
ncbi:MAG: tetratricopeptide repeat protein [Bacteroidota bacterium]|nr:tetratricopeptide repeat protein [Bacteroidota bacterium]MDP4217274.1 tetratricopeptide repeat protein [Bacteroidota bacterium]MDP4253966.1 tetratricopeptide repeat protein [Bacteroidota bacterium]MDP4258377.1 tetratricopeptide repeat protein [Bacteroidota bacterium]